MRYVTYAGESVLTTDSVAHALVELAGAVAAEGEAEAVTIPIVSAGGVIDDADLVVGVGNDVLTRPADYDGDEPDFDFAAASLRAHRSFPHAPHPGTDSDDPTGFDYDPDLDGMLKS